MSAWRCFHPCLYLDREEKKGTRNPRGNVHPESFNPNNPNSTKTVPLIHCPSVIERPKMALAVVYSSSSGSSLHSIHFGSEYAGNVANYRTSMTEIKKRYERSRHTLTLHQNSSLFITLTPSLLSPPMTSLVVWNIKGSSVDNVTWATQSTGKLPKNSRPNSRSPTLRPRWKKSEKGLLIICPGQRETPKTQFSRLPTGSTSTALKWCHKSQSKIYHLYRSKMFQLLQQTLPTHIIKKNTQDSNLKKEGIVR